MVSLILVIRSSLGLCLVLVIRSSPGICAHVTNFLISLWGMDHRKYVLSAKNDLFRSLIFLKYETLTEVNTLLETLEKEQKK